MKDYYTFFYNMSDTDVNKNLDPNDKMAAFKIKVDKTFWINKVKTPTLPLCCGCEKELPHNELMKF